MKAAYRSPCLGAWYPACGVELLRLVRMRRLHAESRARLPGLFAAIRYITLAEF